MLRRQEQQHSKKKLFWSICFSNFPFLLRNISLRPSFPPSSSSSSVDWAEEEEKSFVRFPQGKTKLFPFLRSPSKGDERNKLISLSTPPLLCGGRYTWAGSMGVSPPVGPAPFGTMPRTPTSSNSVTQRTRKRQTFLFKSRKSNNVCSNTVFQAI